MNWRPSYKQDRHEVVIKKLETQVLNNTGNRPGTSQSDKCNAGQRGCGSFGKGSSEKEAGAGGMQGASYVRLRSCGGRGQRPPEAGRIWFEHQANQHELSEERPVRASAMPVSQGR